MAGVSRICSRSGRAVGERGEYGQLVVIRSAQVKVKKTKNSISNYTRMSSISPSIFTSILAKGQVSSL
jgi:hypothetical protein